MTPTTHTLTNTEDRALRKAVAQGEELFAQAGWEKSENNANPQHQGPVSAQPCPDNALWRFELHPEGHGSEQFIGTFTNVLTGVSHELAHRIGPDAVLRPEGLGAVFTEATERGFRNRVVEAFLDPEQPTNITRNVLYEAPSDDAQIRMVNVADAPYAIAVVTDAGSACVLRVPTNDATPVRTLGEACHPRVLIAADQHTIVLSDPNDDGCSLLILQTDTLDLQAENAAATWAEHMSGYFVAGLRLDGPHLHVIAHEGARMSLWRLGLDDSTLEQIPLPADLPCVGIAFAQDAQPCVVLQQADLPPVKISLSRLQSQPKDIPDLSPYREADLANWPLQIPAHDGTMIDVTICCRRDLLDQAQHPLRPLPAVLYSYASYGRPSANDFCATRAELVRSGMLHVMVHLRGGGEYGPTWHRAGRNAQRAQCSDDLEAVADALVSQGYAREDGLIGTSRSAGCQIFALSAARRPKLFRALVLHYPVLNVCRLFASQTSQGSVADLDEWADGDAVQPAICPTKQSKGIAHTPHCLIDMSLEDTRCPPEQAASWLATTESAQGGKRLVRLHADAAHGAPLSPQQARQTNAFIKWALEQPIEPCKIGQK